MCSASPTIRRTEHGSTCSRIARARRRSWGGGRGGRGRLPGRGAVGECARGRRARGRGGARAALWRGGGGGPGVPAGPRPRAGGGGGGGGGRPQVGGAVGVRPVAE